MKILFIIPEEFDGPRWGGVTTYTIELASHLRRRGHDVTILSPGTKSKLYTRNGVRIRIITPTIHLRTWEHTLYSLMQRASAEISYRLLWALSVKRVIESLGFFDGIEAPEWGASTLLLSKKHAKQRVVRLHKSWLMYVRDNNLPESFSTWFIDVLERYCILRASRVTSPTAFMSAQYPILMSLRKLFRLKTEIIPYGIHMSLSKKPGKQFTFEPFILHVGRIEVGKGCILLARAFASLPHNMSSVHLVFVGEDTQVTTQGKQVSCIEYIQSLFSPHILQRVHFVPKKNRRLLNRYYDRCLFFVSASYGFENQSLSLLEALCSGKTAIGSNTGGTPEVINHGKNGLLFEMGNAEDLNSKIVYLIRHPKKRVSFESRVTIERKKYDISRTALQTEKLFSRTLT